MKLRKHHHLVEYMLSSRFKDPSSKAFECFVIRDGICGIGKTTIALEQITHLLLSDPGCRVMYVGVYIHELHRIAGTTEDNRFKDRRPKMIKGKPQYLSKDAEFRQFQQPYNLYGLSKLAHLKQLIDQNRNIAVTHSLFSYFDMEVIELLKKKNYHLIIDEEPSVIECIDDKYSITYTDANDERQEVEGYTIDQTDLRNLHKAGILSINKRTKKLKWVGPKLLRYKDVYDDTCNNHLDFFTDKKGNVNIVWRYNPEVFTSFKTAQLLTYLFKDSMFQLYLDINKIPYLIEDLTEASYYSLRKNKTGTMVPVISELHKLITIYNPVNQYITDLPTPKGGIHAHYTSGYFDTFICDAQLCKSSPIKIAISSFFKAKHPATGKRPKVDQKMWTTVSKAKKALAGNGYKKCFVSFNERATNKYRNANSLAFIYDPRPNPDIVKYIYGKGGKFNMGAYSFSILIQWVFRSTIRDGNPIHIFIASPRLKQLFQKWLNEFQNDLDFCNLIRSAPESSISHLLSPLQNIKTDEFLVIQPGLRHIPKLASLIRGLKGY